MTSRRELEQTRLDAQALVWRDRLHHGITGPAELEEFGCWMAEPEHAEAYAACEWGTACVEALDRSDDPQWREWKEQAMRRARDGAPKVEPLADWSDLVFSQSTRNRRRNGPRIWRHAAALAACVGLAAMVWQWRPGAPPQVALLEYDAASQTREVLLPDGTRLTLDVGTRVAYQESREGRTLDLHEGRVYLQVAKKSDLPRFVVHSDGIDTIVLGTRFQVSRGAAGTEVMLEEGAVRVQRRDTDVSATLVPGERARWQESTGEFVKEQASSTQMLAWTRGRLLFQDTTLTEAVAEVNRYATGVRLELADARAARLRISGSFVAGDAELVAASWEATLPLRVEHHGDRISLSHR